MIGQACRVATRCAVATLMWFRAVPLPGFAYDRLDDPRASALMARVRVQIDPEWAAEFPAQRPAKVELR
jgi:2-methylcitrate dehydratase PrpD